MELEERIYSLSIQEESQDEIIALSSIFEGELEIEELKNGKTVVYIQIHPSEGERRLSGQERRITLTLTLTYTSEAKTVSIRNCKGLSNDRICKIESIISDMERADENIFDIIEVLKENVDEMNKSPDGECPICLFPFEQTNLYKACCFHLFHMDCFTKFIFETLSRVKKENEKLPDDHKVSELIHCPVCREVLDVSPGEFRKYRGREVKKVDISENLNENYHQLAIKRQKELSLLYFQKQKENDGHFSETVNCLYIRPTESNDTVENEESLVVQPTVEDNNSALHNDGTNENSRTNRQDNRGRRGRRNHNNRGYRGKNSQYRHRNDTNESSSEKRNFIDRSNNKDTSYRGYTGYRGRAKRGENGGISRGQMSRGQTSRGKSQMKSKKSENLKTEYSKTESSKND